MISHLLRPLINKRTKQSTCINPTYPVVPAERVQVVASVLLDGVAGEPPPQLGRIVPVAVVVEARLGVVVLRAEAEGEDGGHGTRGGQRPSEGVVLIRRDDLARLGDVVRDVAVVVVEREVPHAADLGREEAADAARAVEGAGEVLHQT